MLILIIGCGRVGSAVAKDALNAGHEVSVLDSDPLSHERLDKDQTTTWEDSGGRFTVSAALEIDGLIGKHTEHWRMDRMATVDRNVLRGAVAEFLGYPATPRAVVINEALEIARKFSTPESVQFINGVLDSVGKEVGT